MVVTIDVAVVHQLDGLVEGFLACGFRGVFFEFLFVFSDFIDFVLCFCDFIGVVSLCEVLLGVC